MVALLDLDLLVYRIGFTTLDVPVGFAIHRLDKMIGGILSFLGTNDYRGFLTSTDKSNFRHAIYPEYKANRIAPKPLHYDVLRNHLICWHGAEVVYGQEADDALAQNQKHHYTGSSQDFNAYKHDTCIVSIDKDLLQIPGMHFNFVKGILQEVSKIDGLRSFYRSLLVGDATDNIPGVRGIGPKTAAKIIDHLETEKEMHAACLEAYTKEFKEDATETLNRNAQLLFIRREEGIGWICPNEVSNRIRRDDARTPNSIGQEL